MLKNGLAVFSYVGSVSELERIRQRLSPSKWMTILKLIAGAFTGLISVCMGV